MSAVLAYCDAFPLDKFKAGEVLLAEGPATNRMYILAAGGVEVLRGGTQITEIASPGAIFGEIAALLGGNHTATVRALGDVSVRSASSLYDDDLSAANTLEAPDRVGLRPTPTAGITDGTLRIVLPPVSWTAVELGSGPS